MSSPLDNGEVISDVISVVGQVDEYTFTANVGESVILRVADTQTTEFVNSDFVPRIELLDPSDSVVAVGQGALVGNIIVGLVKNSINKQMVIE